MKKRIAYANKKIADSFKSRRRNYLLFTIVAIIGLAGMTFASNPTEQTFDNLGKYGGGVTLSAIVMTSIGNIPEGSNAEKQGKQIYYKVYLLAVGQWDETAGFPPRVDGSRATIPVLNGEKWHYIGTVDDTAELGINAEAGEIASAITNDLKCVIGGINKKIRKFLEDGLGEKFFIVVKATYGNKMFVGGDGVKPMKLMSFAGGILKDNTSFALEFKNESIYMWSEYTGALPTVEPVTVPADAITITLTADADVYNITSGTTVPVNITGFTGITESQDLKIIELVGLGGSNPATIDDDDTFVLRGGATWTSAAGARISFQIFKDGTSTHRLIEVPGSRKE